MFPLVSSLLHKLPYRVVSFGLLNRRILGVLPVGLHRIRSIALGSATIAASQRLQKAVVLPCSRIDAAETSVAYHRFSASRDELRDGRG